VRECADDGTGDEPIISRAALQVHTAGIVNSVRDGHPGFVGDEYLDAISAETTITTLELCSAGLWQRVQGGYEIQERGLVQMAADQFRIEEERRRACRETGGHEPHEECSWICRKCGDPLVSPPD
jgi:hypothetical protein